jgi:hypothetical protein
MNNDIPKDQYTASLSNAVFFYLILSLGFYFIVPLAVLFALFGHSAG